MKVFMAFCALMWYELLRLLLFLFSFQCNFNNYLTLIFVLAWEKGSGRKI